MQSFTVLILMLFMHCLSAKWLKMYDENYHRPTYYNRAHSSQQHVDYNRKEMDERDIKPTVAARSRPLFDPKEHTSYYVNILYKSSVFCAGALISQRMVVTSSRCFLVTEPDITKEFKARHMTVITGNEFAISDAHPKSVIAFFMPSSKLGNRDVHDIALLALHTKLDRNEFRYIKLYNNMPKVGNGVDIAFVDAQSREITLYPTKVVAFKLCKETYEQSGKTSIPFDKEFFCVKNRKVSGCSTRPGDPLIINNFLAGINIYGEQCDELEEGPKLDIYYSVHHTVKFIQFATDLLRAFTGTGPFNASATTRRTQLIAETTTEGTVTTV